MALTFDLEIWKDGQDEPETVRADQRDCAAFELEYRVGTGEALEKQPMVFFRFIGWHAMRRVGRTDLSVPREEWLSKIISIEPPDDDPITGSTPDPGSPAV